MNFVDRETAVRALAREGMSRDAIAAKLRIGTQTVTRDAHAIAHRTAVDLAKQGARRTIPDGANWRFQALCALSPDPDIWFRRDDLVAVATAKAVCARCPVAALCEDSARARREKAGTWGHLTARPRAHRRIQADAPPTHGLTRQEMT